MKFSTPAGTPASMNIFIRYQLESSEVVAGFQTTVLPIMTGAIGRFAARAVKLKGEMA